MTSMATHQHQQQLHNHTTTAPVETPLGTKKVVALRNGTANIEGVPMVQAVGDGLDDLRMRKKELLQCAPTVVTKSCIEYGRFLQRYKRDFKGSLHCFRWLIASFLDPAISHPDEMGMVMSLAHRQELNRRTISSHIYQGFAYGLYNCDRLDEASGYYLLSMDREIGAANELEMATLLSLRGKQRESNKYFERAVKRQPGNSDVYLLWSVALLLHREYDSAEKYLTECLALTVGTKEAKQRKEEQLQNEQNNNNAPNGQSTKGGKKRKRKEMTVRDGGTAIHEDAQFLKAMLLMERGALRPAESAFKALLKAFNGSADGHCFYANCLADLKRREVAEKHWENAIHLDAAHLTTHYYYGMWLWHNGEGNKALYHLRECVRHNGADLHSNNTMNRSVITPMHNDVMASNQTPNHITPSNVHWNSRFVLAALCFERRQWKEAEKHLKAMCDAMNLDDDRPQNMNENMIYTKNYADCLVQIGEKQLAVEQYTKSLALLQRLKKRYIDPEGERERAFRSAAQTQCRCKLYLNGTMQPHHGSSYIGNHSNSNRKSNKHSEHSQIKGMTMDPDAFYFGFYSAFECDTREKLASCLSRCKELKSAYTECERCLKLCPGHIEAVFRFASILSNLHRFKAADRYFKKCLEFTKQKHGKCWNNYGVMKLNLAQYEEAMHFFKKAQYVLKHQPAALREVQKNIDLCSRKRLCAKKTAAFANGGGGSSGGTGTMSATAGGHGNSNTMTVGTVSKLAGKMGGGAVNGGGSGGTGCGAISKQFDDDEKGRTTNPQQHKQSFYLSQIADEMSAKQRRVDPFNFAHSASGGSVDGSNINGVERTAIITMTNSNHHNDSDITMNIQIQSTTSRGAAGGPNRKIGNESRPKNGRKAKKGGKRPKKGKNVKGKGKKGKR